MTPAPIVRPAISRPSTAAISEQQHEPLQTVPNDAVERDLAGDLQPGAGVRRADDPGVTGNDPEHEPEGGMGLAAMASRA